MKIDINIPLFFYGSNERMLATKVVLKNYSRIVDFLSEKYNTELTLSIIGSEKELSKKFMEENYDKEYTYHEFDQKLMKFDPTARKGRHILYDMISKKFQYGFKRSFEKKPNIALLAGSNDFISYRFFEQVVNFYRNDQKQIYGICSYDNGRKNKVLYHTITNELKFSDEMFWTTGVAHGRDKFLYVGGIYGMNDAIFEPHVEYVIKNTSYDEGSNEQKLLQIRGTVPLHSKNCYFVNIKVSDPKCELTPGYILIDGLKKNNRILDYESFDEEFKNDFEKEYMSIIKQYK